MKKSPLRITAIFMMMAATVTHADTWHADPISGCTIFDADETGAEVLVSWSGNCDSKKRASGNGVLSWIEDGQLAGRYDGHMKDGKAHGFGKIYTSASDGGFDRFEGTFSKRRLSS